MVVPLFFSSGISAFVSCFLLYISGSLYSFPSQPSSSLTLLFSVESFQRRLFEGKERVQAAVGIVLMEREGECIIYHYSFLCLCVHLCFVTPIAVSAGLDKQWHLSNLSLKKFTGCLDEVHDKATKKTVCVFIYLWFMYRLCQQLRLSIKQTDDQGIMYLKYVEEWNLIQI